MTIKKIALEYLEKEKLLNIDMIESINRNTCKILYADAKAVLLLEKSSEAYMLSTENIDLTKKLISNLSKKDLFVVHQKELFNIIKDNFNYINHFECKQVAYLDNMPIDISINSNITIKKLSENHKEIVSNTYKSMEGDSDYTSYLIDNKYMWGAFDNEELLGFIGIHSEGSIGLLEVLPQYRNKGVAQALQKHLINYSLSKRWVPFGQVFIDNKKSMNLQNKLGLSISKESVFWLY